MNDKGCGALLANIYDFLPSLNLNLNLNLPFLNLNLNLNLPLSDY